MNKIPNDYFKLQLPDYSVCAIEYGDFSGCTSEEEENIQDFLKGLPENGNFEIHYDEDSDFCNDPEFGLPCNCLDVKYHFYNETLFK